MLTVVVSVVVMMVVVMIMVVMMLGVMMMVVVVMMPLMVGDDAINSDGGVIMVAEAPLTGARESIWQCGCTPLYFCQIISKFLMFAKVYIFQYWIRPCLDTVSD